MSFVDLFNDGLEELGIKPVKPNKGRELEEKGWKEWLLTLFPFWFEEQFSKEHEQYWELHWECLRQIKKGIEPDASISTKMLLLGRGLGKCIDGDTDITMANGTRKKMRDIQVGDKIVSYNERFGCFEPDTIKHKWASGKKDCLRITTYSHKQLTLTPDHRVLTFDGWKRAGELVKGDRIAAPCNIPVFTFNKQAYSDEEIRLLAYFLAEGSTTHSKQSSGVGFNLNATLTEVLWDTIVDIENAGIKDTFDVEVERNHNFLTNNLVSHNSAVIECARVMRGAILKEGYSLIISETDDQAQEHLGNCRVLIEHPDSKLLEYYPHMEIGDGGDLMKGMPTADRKEMFITKSGYIFRSKGLQAKMRGLRVGTFRPSDIAFDDIDDVNDSLAVSANKLRLITASILPVQARKFVTIDFGQNLIGENSVVNQIYTGKTDAFANKTVIGVANAFETLNIDSGLDATGKLRHKILDTSVPSWQGLDVLRAQKFLDNSGLQTFMAEYQNEFSQFKSGKVIPEYNEDVQIITWSQFEKVFGQRRIPRHWKVGVGLDVGYSEGLYPHWSAWSFIATASVNSGMAGALFVYRSRTFKGTSIDDQATAILSDLYSDENGCYEKDEMIASWQMSHERTGEMMTLWEKYKLPFGKFRYYKAEDGVAQWRHLSRADKRQKHPFKEDRQNDDGTWVLGRPSMYYIVDDMQVITPQDDKGMKLLRDQVSAWEYVPVKLTETGQTQQKPSKVADDVPDSIKSIVCWFGNEPTPLTKEEEIMEAMPEVYKGELNEQGLVSRNLWLQQESLQTETDQQERFTF